MITIKKLITDYWGVGYYTLLEGSHCEWNTIREFKDLEGAEQYLNYLNGGSWEPFYVSRGTQNT